MSEPSFCRSCGAAILWVKTEAGKAIPLNQLPVEAGNVILRFGPTRGQETTHVETVEETAARILAGGVAFISHFSTCPQAKTWRRKKT